MVDGSFLDWTAWYSIHFTAALGALNRSGCSTYVIGWVYLAEPMISILWEGVNYIIVLVSPLQPCDRQSFMQTGRWTSWLLRLLSGKIKALCANLTSRAWNPIIHTCRAQTLGLSFHAKQVVFIAQSNSQIVAHWTRVVRELLLEVMVEECALILGRARPEA